MVNILRNHWFSKVRSIFIEDVTEKHFDESRRIFIKCRAQWRIDRNLHPGGGGVKSAGG